MTPTPNICPAIRPGDDRESYQRRAEKLRSQSTTSSSSAQSPLTPPGSSVASSAGTPRSSIIDVPTPDTNLPSTPPIRSKRTLPSENGSPIKRRCIRRAVDTPTPNRRAQKPRQMKPPRQVTTTRKGRSQREENARQDTSVGEPQSQRLRPKPLIRYIEDDILLRHVNLNERSTSVFSNIQGVNGDQEEREETEDSEEDLMQSTESDNENIRPGYAVVKKVVDMRDPPLAFLVEWEQGGTRTWVLAEDCSCPDLIEDFLAATPSIEGPALPTKRCRDLKGRFVPDLPASNPSTCSTLVQGASPASGRARAQTALYSRPRSVMPPENPLNAGDDEVKLMYSFPVSRRGAAQDLEGHPDQQIKFDEDSVALNQYVPFKREFSEYHVLGKQLEQLAVMRDEEIEIPARNVGKLKEEVEDNSLTDLYLNCGRLVPRAFEPSENQLQASKVSTTLVLPSIEDPGDFYHLDRKQGNRMMIGNPHEEDELEDLKLRTLNAHPTHAANKVRQLRKMLQFEESTASSSTTTLRPQFCPSRDVVKQVLGPTNDFVPEGRYGFQLP